MRIRLVDGSAARSRGHELLIGPGDAAGIAAVAREEMVVLLAPGAILRPESASRLCRAAAASGGAVPRSPSVRGRQHYTLAEGDDVTRAEGRARIEARLLARYRGQREQLVAAAPLALALPGAPAAAALAEPWTSAEEVFRRAMAGRRVVLAYDALAVGAAPVATLLPAAPRSGPLVSACLIARDEEVWIADAIASVAGLADEVVVYDTGSLDATREVAAAAGARVVEGFWDDDFAAARRRAAAHARGEWILWLDADERLGGDLESARARLEDPFAVWEGYSVRIRNLTGVGLTFADHFAVRLFRRGALTWRGAIHETLWSRDEARPAVAVRAAELHLIHLGYLDVVMRRRGKGDRNLRVAERNESAALPLEAIVHRARSHLLAANFDEVVGIVEEHVLTASPGPLRKLGLLAGTEAALALGRLDLAETFVAALETQLDVHPAFALAARARLETERHDPAAALEALSRITERVDDTDGLVVDPAGLVGMRARCLAELGRPDEAALEALQALGAGLLEVSPSELVAWMEGAGMDLGQIAHAVRPEQRTLVAASVLAEVEVAERLLWALAEADPAERVWLAAGELASRRADPSVRERWLARLREAGLEPALSGPARG